jgi:hypothetical protein
VDVSELPVAGTFGGPGDSRPGRMDAPSLVTCTALGTIVVLDIGANNLQAFGVDGTPGNQFADAGGARHAAARAPLVTTKDATTYLSLSSDGAGFLYVLSYQDAGTTSSYQVDIYDVDGGHVNTAKGINVAAFAVDYWRNPFTLNFQPVLGPDGKPVVLADFHTQEPSLSGWTVRTPM